MCLKLHEGYRLKQTVCPPHYNIHQIIYINIIKVEMKIRQLVSFERDHNYCTIYNMSRGVVFNIPALAEGEWFYVW